MLPPHSSRTGPPYETITHYHLEQQGKPLGSSHGTEKDRTEWHMWKCQQETEANNESKWKENQHGVGYFLLVDGAEKSDTCDPRRERRIEIIMSNKSCYVQFATFHVSSHLHHVVTLQAASTFLYLSYAVHDAFQAVPGLGSRKHRVTYGIGIHAPNTRTRHGSRVVL